MMKKICCLSIFWERGTVTPLDVKLKSLIGRLATVEKVPDTNTEVPLQRIENALGHFLHFTRTPDGTLTDISATGGTRVHLHYDNPLGRLTDIKRVADNQAVETLTQYRYGEHGQLTAVINRNGDTVRSFSYAECLMVTHSNALGLGCHYRWETQGGKPRVVEHVRADFVARDAHGNLHVFEVKHGSGTLTKNQKASGGDMSNPANTTQHLGWRN